MSDYTPEKVTEARAKLAQHAMRRDLGAMPKHIHTVLDALTTASAERDEALAALSRAEETIEKALGATDMAGEWIIWDSGEAYDILTEYSEQKGADRG